MTDLVSPVVDRLVTLVNTVDNIGLVHKFSPRDRKDIQRLIVSHIDGAPTLRAWWVQGPTMEAEWLTGFSPQHIARLWTYEIHGIEGILPWEGLDAPTGGDIPLLRDNASAVCDAIDGDGNDLNGTVFDSEPCRIIQQPFHDSFLERSLPLAYVVVTKRVRTMPAR